LGPTGPRAFFGALQAATDFPNAEPLLTDPEKDLPDHAGFFLYNVIVGTASALGFAHISIAIGRAAKHVNIADLGSLACPTPTTLQNLGPLILGDQALHLEEEFIFGTPT